MKVRRVLLVDDDDLQRQVLKVDLEAEGWEVDEADCTEEALDSARLVRPDVAVLDVVMPGRDGFDCLREFKRDPMLRSIPVIMLTAKDQIDDELQGIAEGADQYLMKPAHRNTVIQAIHGLLQSNEKREP